VYISSGTGQASVGTASAQAQQKKTNHQAVNKAFEMTKIVSKDQVKAHNANVDNPPTMVPKR